MIRTFLNAGFKWIDILDPTSEELNQVAGEHKIHEAFIADALQPEHLPKYEPLGNTSFLILRYYKEDDASADTIQELTNKIAVFHKDGVVITIHRHEIDFINDLKKKFTDTGKCKGTFHLLNRVIKAVLHTYEDPAHQLAAQIDDFEAETFLKKNPPKILRSLYHVKRKVEVSRRLLLLSKDILEQIDDPAHQDPNTRDTRDLYVRILTLFDSMSENTNHLLTLYFSISAQRTNEVIRVLTLFSVFFMPLTFIVGIYGMNFEFMPELKSKFGYPAVMIFMVVITLAIFSWFRRKEWL
jgi:magnesium transporter